MKAFKTGHTQPESRTSQEPLTLYIQHIKNRAGKERRRCITQELAKGNVQATSAPEQFDKQCS
jgi:hypothetical protein